jgi:hypothetical protein
MTPGPELRDIHLPPEPSWWPPAPGWWLLAVIATALLWYVSRWLLRRARERRWRRRVHAELERIAKAHAALPDAVLLAAGLSHLLRRTTRLIDPAAVALRDEAWLAFLDRQLPRARAVAEPFRNGAGRVLIEAPYRPSTDPALQSIDARALLDLVRDWLVAVLPRGHARA